MQRYLPLLILILICISCANTDYSPKPRGYHRIEFPERAYSTAKTEGCPYTFEIPLYSQIVDDNNSNSKPCWKNIDFPQFNARLHLSYFPISKDATLDELTEDARTFVFKHTTKASAIDQVSISRPEHNIKGLEYIIQGNTASNYQFYVTDEQKNYIRGALYFNEKPNLDSIQPVLEFLKTDIKHIINTIRWK